MKLPFLSRTLLQTIIRHLKVISNQPSNLMGIKNLSLVFGPTLVKTHHDLDKSIKDMQHQIQIVESLIENFDVIFSAQRRASEPLMLAELSPHQKTNSAPLILLKDSATYNVSRKKRNRIVSFGFFEKLGMFNPVVNSEDTLRSSSIEKL